MKAIIPEKVMMSINSYKRIDLRKNATKLYCILLKLNERKNEHTGWFDAPSSYLKSINTRYYKIIDKFIEDGIIEYYKRLEGDKTDIFKSVEKKYYNKSLGFCMRYRFLIDINIGTEIDFDNENPNKFRWFDITKNSLIALAYEPKITRDSFGQRVHHPLIYSNPSYKETLKGSGLSIIDAKCSQPRLLWLIMKERGYYDKEYFTIFETGIDFYLYVVTNLNLKNRQQAKDLFYNWTFSNGYVPNTGIYKLFPSTSNFIKTLKTRNYKDASSFLQRREAKIWIDDLLQNIPTNFALSIHDALLVRTVEANKILLYCKTKYPELELKLDTL